MYKHKKTASILIILTMLTSILCLPSLAEEDVYDIQEELTEYEAASIPEEAEQLFPEEVIVEPMPEVESGAQFLPTDETWIPRPGAEPFNYDRQAQYQFLKDWKEDGATGYTDEFLFGAPGTAAGGKLDYDRFPEMHLIKAAVIGGNYQLAKEELLTYYRNKFLTVTPILNKFDTANRRDYMTMRMMENDFTFNDNTSTIPVDIFTIENEERWYSIDVFEDITALLSGEEITIELIALKKDGGVAEFRSRSYSGNDEYAPYLEYVVNGVTHRVKAADTTYVSPLENRNTNYKGDLLMVEESVSSIFAGRNSNGKTLITVDANRVTQPGIGVSIDKNTKRTYLRFDTSQLSSTGIENASVKLYGKNTGSTNDMEIVAFRTGNASWKEDTTRWTTFTDHLAFSFYGEGWYGFPDQTTSGKFQNWWSRYHEEMVRWNFHVSHSAKMYNTDRENKDLYASIFWRQWTGWMRDWGNVSTSQHTLDFPVRTASVIYGFLPMIQSEYCTPEIWAATVKYMYRSGAFMDRGLLGTNNVGIFHCKGFATVNAYFNEFTTHFQWATRLRGLITSITGYVTKPDGASAEGAIGYALYALDDMLGWVNPNVEIGITDPRSAVIEGGLDSSIGRNIRNCFYYILDIVGPDYCDNQRGDGSSYVNGFTGTFKKAYEAFGDKEFQYAATRGKYGVRREQLAAYYPSVRVASMRTGWEPKDLYLYHDVSSQSSHAHSDHNNIIMFAYGQYLLTDQLYYSYTDNYWRPIFHSTRQHNTVEIDNGQRVYTRTNTGLVNDFIDNKIFTLTNMSTNQKDDTTTHTRNVVFVRPEFWIVSDYMKTPSSTTRTYNQNWHVLPGANPTIDTDTGAARTNFNDSANLVIAQAKVDGVTPRIATDGVFSLGTGNKTENVPFMEYKQSRAGNAIYDTLIIPEEFGNKITATAERIDLEDVTNNGVVAMDFEIKNTRQSVLTTLGSYYLVHDAAQKKTRNFGEHTTDAAFAYVDRNSLGKLSHIMLKGGTVVSNRSEGALFKSTRELNDFGIEHQSGAIYLSSTEADFDLSCVTFRTDKPVGEVYFNNVYTPHKIKGAYVYFGDSPIIDDGTVLPTDPNPPVIRPPTHGGSSGGGGGSVILPKPTPAPDPNPDPSDPEISDGQEIIDIFDDIADVKWAHDYIKTLYELGVIQGDGNKKFNPLNPVKREEFVKMLVSTLKIPLETEIEEELPFKDLDSEAWYMPYVYTAYKAGLIKGISDNEFGVGLDITRQDIAVIIVRAVNNLDITLPSTENDIPFKDEYSIGLYALDSVNTLRDAGILNGDESGNFRPLSKATRAESAKIFGVFLGSIKVEE